jgi:hypothetical protein
MMSDSAILTAILEELRVMRQIQERMAVPVASEMGRQAAALLTNKKARDEHNRAVLRGAKNRQVAA